VNPKLKELQGKVAKLRKELKTILEQAGDELDMSKVTAIDGDSATKVAYFQAIDAELNDSMKAMEPLLAEHGALARAREALAKFGEPVGRPAMPEYQLEEHQRPTKSFGKSFVDGWIEAGRVKDRTFEIADVDVRDVKTVFATTAGWAPETLRTGRMVDDAQRPIQVIDVIPAGSTSQSAVVYMEETTFTNAAAETAEAGTYQEAALALTEMTSPVRKIAVFLPVTDEQLEDVPQVQGYLNNRLPFMLRQRLDGQILTGNGTPPNLMGFLNVVGIQTQAKGTDPVPDAIYKAMTKIRVTGRAVPSHVILHPNDWQDIRLLRTADGLYIWGSPSDPGVERIWGLPVVQADSITENTGLVGDLLGYTELTTRRGVEVKVSDSHGTFFVEGKQAIRADFRVALVVYRPAALCTVTGI
jgi:HK97 family phage major capsid protein